MPSDATVLTPVTPRRSRADQPPGFDTFRPNVTAPDISTPNPHGRIIIDLIPKDSGWGFYPVIRCEPVGYFTSGLFEQHSLHFAQEIERAQAALKHAAAQKETAA